MKTITSPKKRIRDGPRTEDLTGFELRVGRSSTVVSLVILADVQEEPLAIGRITVKFSLTGCQPNISVYPRDKTHSALFIANICSSIRVWHHLLVGFDPIRVNSKLSLP